MNSALDDLIVVIEWLASSKTPTVRVAEALERLKKRRHSPAPTPVDVRTETFADDGKVNKDST